MATRTQKIQLGTFLGIALVLLIGTTIAMTGAQFWEERHSYRVLFAESVSGLEIGAPVKYRGVRVGSVTAIQIAENNVENVEVKLNVDSLTPVSTDTQALITTQGITGLKFIELMGGSESSQRLEPGSYIQAGQSVFDQLTGRASDITLKIEQLINNFLTITKVENQERIEGILTQSELFLMNLNSFTVEITEIAKLLRRILEDNEQPFHATLGNVEKTTHQAHLVLAQTNTMLGNIDHTLAQMKLPDTFAQVRDTNAMVQGKVQEVNVGEAMESMSIALSSLRLLLEGMTQTMNQNQDQLRATLHNLRITSDSLKEFGRSVQEQPSRLIFDEQPAPRQTP